MAETLACERVPERLTEQVPELFDRYVANAEFEPSPFMMLAASWITELAPRHATPRRGAPRSRAPSAGIERRSSEVVSGHAWHMAHVRSGSRSRNTHDGSLDDLPADPAPLCTRQTGLVSRTALARQGWGRGCVACWGRGAGGSAQCRRTQPGYRPLQPRTGLPTCFATDAAVRRSYLFRGRRRGEHPPPRGTPALPRCHSAQGGGPGRGPVCD